MTNTNSELSRLAAERLANERQLRGTEAFAAKVIADTYADAVQGWIPCSERMPEDHQLVLFHDGKKTHYGWSSTWLEGWNSRTDNEFYENNQVTHWQPLPQPPEATT